MKKLFFLITAFLCLTNLSAGQNTAGNPFLNFEKTFIGTIGAKSRITMEIRANNGIITGRYCYHHVGTDIRLNGFADTNGALILKEYTPQGKAFAQMSGTFGQDFVITNGKWARTDGTSPLALFLKPSDSSYVNLKDHAINQPYRLLCGIYEIRSAGAVAASVSVSYCGNRKFIISLEKGHSSGCFTGFTDTLRMSQPARGSLILPEVTLQFVFDSGRLVISQDKNLPEYGQYCQPAGTYIRKTDDEP